MTNAYLTELHAILPRVLSFFSRDKHSKSYGIGDRQHISWCTIDFANGTQQGAAHGLARLLHAGLLPDWCDTLQVQEIINSAFVGTKAIMRPNGSMEEAFPFESSFCVTALVAHDLLWAEKLCPAENEEEKDFRLNTIKPLMHFLLKHDEVHGIISNHLATAVGALFLWHELTGDIQAEKRAHFFLQRILNHACLSEGWFKEYDGADPGYQSLCLHYLSLVHEIRPDLELEQKIIKSIEFLSYFAFPSGSFGGIFGSRRTRLWYPTAGALLANTHPIAASLSHFMEQSVAKHSCVCLSAMDDQNLIPMFNAYAVAATTRKHWIETALPPLPCHDLDFNVKEFTKAGLYISATNTHYTVVCLRLGCAYESCTRDGKTHHVDGGSLLQLGKKVWSTQVHDGQANINHTASSITITTRFAPILRTRPTPLQLMALRILSLSIMRLTFFSCTIKKIMAHLLMGKKKFSPQQVERRIDFSGEIATTEAKLLNDKQFAIADNFIANGKDFSSIHMASVGYWQGVYCKSEEKK